MAKDYDQEKTSSEKDGTAFTDKFRARVKMFLGGLTVLTLLGYISYNINEYLNRPKTADTGIVERRGAAPSQANPTAIQPNEYWKIPSDTVPRERWPKQMVEPGKKSAHIEIPAFKPIHYEIEGDGNSADYDVYLYYRPETKKPDCLSTAEAQCSTPFEGIYFLNKRNDHPITMSYALAASG